MMVTNLTIGKKKYIDVEAEMEDIRSRLEALQQELVGLTDRDAEAFEPLSRAYGLPKETEEQRIEKERVMEKALYEASVVPLQIMKTVFRVMEALEVLGEKGSRLAVSDVGVAVLFARAALEGASLNIYINTRLMKNREQAERLNKESDEMCIRDRYIEVYVSHGCMQTRHSVSHARNILTKRTGPAKSFSGKRTFPFISTENLTTK